MADYIVNMGGYNGSVLNTIDVFKVTAKNVQHITNHSLTLSQARQSLAAASCGDYILALGGLHGITNLNTIDVFHVNSNGVDVVTGHGLTLSVPRCRLAAASCGNYILALGGYTSGSNNYSNAVDVFKVTESGIEHITDHGLTLSQGRQNLSAVSCGNYILAIGGSGEDQVTFDTVDVFKVTENGVEHITDHGLSLSYASDSLAAASAGNYILAMGGLYGVTDAVNVFKVTENGVEAVSDHGLSLSEPRQYLAAASCGDYIFALGGISGGSIASVDMFHVTENGVEAVPAHGLSLSQARFSLKAVNAGNYILAMGGYNNSYLNTVDVFQVFN